MVVYVEQVFIDNFVMTMLVCLITNRIMRYQTKWFNVIIISFVGTVVSIIYPMLNFYPIFSLAFKLGLGIALGSLLVLGRQKKCLGITVFFVSTFLMGGLIFAVCYSLYQNVALALSSPVAPLPIGILLIVSVVFYLIIKKIFFAIHKVTDKNAFEQVVRVHIGEHVFMLNGYVDSGNFIYHRGQPVALISNFSLQKKISKFAKFDDKIKVSTICGDMIIPVLRACKMVLYSGTSMNILYDIPLGLTDRRFANFDILLPPAILNIA